jgi:hypothetical protein
MQRIAQHFLVSVLTGVGTQCAYWRWHTITLGLACSEQSGGPGCHYSSQHAKTIGPTADTAATGWYGGPVTFRMRPIGKDKRLSRSFLDGTRQQHTTQLLCTIHPLETKNIKVAKTLEKKNMHC